MARRILVTGGAGFIGSALVRYLLTHTDAVVLNVDKLTYAGNLLSLTDVIASERYQFAQQDIVSVAAMLALLDDFQPDVVMHLAAESHVDNSIAAPAGFIQTNIVGTYSMLEASLQYWKTLPAGKQQQFRFHHVSTDEVYGDLGEDLSAVTESSVYLPSSPYSASKAASDHLVRAWHRTYGLPVLLSHSSNNYGAFQFPEKLIPRMISNALCGLPLPLYGSGLQIRDWIYVDDHVRALYLIATCGEVGETYHVGGKNQIRNIDLVKAICSLLDELAPQQADAATGYGSLIQFVADRPGHDHRYAMDTTKIEQTLGWQPQEALSDGLRKTVLWYLQNTQWSNAVLKKTVSSS